MLIRRSGQAALLLMGMGLLACTGTGAWSPNGPTTAVTRAARGATGGALVSVGYYNGCMAVVIAPKVALTAAHCVQGRAPTSAQLLLGNDIGLPLYRIPVLGFVASPKYSNANRNGDLVMLQLGIAAPVPPAPVLDALTDDYLGAELVVAGYGSSGGGGRGHNNQLEVLRRPLFVLQSDTLRFDNADQACFGDNGAPVFVAEAAGGLLLAGISSYTTTPGCSGLTVASRVDTEVGFLGVTPATPAQTAPATPTPGAPQSGCNGETAQGRCSGDTLIYCDGNQAVVTNCAASKTRCVWSYLDLGYACGAAATPSGSGACSSASFVGRCEDNVSVWCNGSQKEVRDDCALLGQTCGYNRQLGIYDCLPPATT